MNFNGGYVSRRVLLSDWCWFECVIYYGKSGYFRYDWKGLW